MSEPVVSTFSLIILSFTKSAESQALIRGLSAALEIGAEEARALIRGVPKTVMHGADKATTRQLARQLLALGAELCVRDEQTGVEKVHYPGSAFTDDEVLVAPDPAPTSGPRSRPDAVPTSLRSADAGASMRDALRHARQRTQGLEGGPVSVRPPSEAAPISIRNLPDGAPISGRSSAPSTPRVTSSVPPPASLPPASRGEVSSHPPSPAQASPSTPPHAHAPHAHAPHAHAPHAPHSLHPHTHPHAPHAHAHRPPRSTDEADARRGRLKRGAIVLAGLVVLAGAGLAASMLGPTPLGVVVDGKAWNATLPPGGALRESTSTTLLTALGPVRMMVSTATAKGSIGSCAFAHLTFARPPKLDGPTLDKVMQEALDDLAPGAKLQPGEPLRKGKHAGQEARFSGASGALPFGKVRVVVIDESTLALLMVAGAGEKAADGPEAHAFLDSFSPP